MADDIKSQLRVFLSADLVGSTKLKNQLNHQELLAKYRSRKRVIERLREFNQGLVIDEASERKAILESLGVSSEDTDWATVVKSFYQGIHSTFITALSEFADAGDLSADYRNPKPWKAVGDELIYELPMSGRICLHWITIAFLRTIREIDKSVSQSKEDGKQGLRIKGAAWVAGFPVRNREIQLPPDDRADYLGPDMDTGFRLGKCTRSGMLLLSAEIAELLGECQGKVDPLRSRVVGWESLKGVWNDQRYPVIWADFPAGHPAAKSHPATTFTVWEQEDCRWCKQWESGQMKSVCDIAEDLRQIRESLPRSLGLVDPYIIGDSLEHGSIDEDHKRVLELLEQIEAMKAETNSQDAPQVAATATELEQSKTDIQKLMKKASQGLIGDSEPAD